MRSFYLVLFLCVFFVFGCSGYQIKQMTLGMSASDVEKFSKKYEKIFTQTKDYCFDKSLAALKRLDTDITKRKRKDGFILASGFDHSFEPAIDTTEVGILIKPIDQKNTKVTVVSDSGILAEFVSKEVFKDIQAS